MRWLLSGISVVVFILADAVHAAPKPPPLQIRIHPEGHEREGDSFVTKVQLLNPSKEVYIRKVPIVSEQDFVAFYPFSNPNGTMGAYFLLNAHGRNKLEQHTTSARDQIVIAMINGRIGSALRVDQKVTDGILFVPAGILGEEIVELQAKLPIIGSEKKFSEQKKQATDALKALRKEREKQAAEARKQKKDT
jgi:hypothetical protein